MTIPRDFPIDARLLMGESITSSLCEQACLAEQRSNESVSLASLWYELLHGSCRVVHGCCSSTRCLLVTGEVAAPQPPLTGRRLMILQQVLAGVPQNAVAVDLLLAPSTVAVHARGGLEQLGTSDRPSRAHPVLMLAAKAALLNDHGARVAVSPFTWNQRRFRVFSVRRPERHLEGRVPRAELDVIRGLIDGECYRTIARRRGTSTRTIANQIAAVFRRLEVSGRNELVLRLFERDGFLPSRSSELRPLALEVRAASA